VERLNRKRTFRALYVLCLHDLDRPQKLNGRDSGCGVDAGLGTSRDSASITTYSCDFFSPGEGSSAMIELGGKPCDGCSEYGGPLYG
jgi:hypothetical protein